MAFLRAAVCAALFLSGTARALSAQDVTLASPDGEVEVTGTLLGFDGEYYRVETQFGELTVDGSGVSCEGPGCPNLSAYVAEVTLSGSSAMADVLLPALIEGFSLRNGLQTRREQAPGSGFTYVLLKDGRAAARIHFLVSDTDTGFADLLAGDADIVMALREIRAGERDRARKAGLGDLTEANRGRVAALDALVPIVAPDNPVRQISLPQLAAVFAGRITNWKALGGPDAPVGLHLPAAGSGLSQSVEDRLLKPAGMELAADIRRHGRSSGLARSVMTDPFAIGIASFAETGSARALTLTGSCGFSLSASRQSIKTEDYPLTSPMFLYLPARRLPQIAREFLSYLQGTAAQTVIRRAGFVDQRPEGIPLSTQGTRLANAIRSAGAEGSGLAELQRMAEAFDGLERLTLSVRFEPGSARPDAQSRANILQLAGALEAGAYDGKRLVFAGFSDGEGPAEGNRRIALKRAEAVRDAVAETAETADLTRVEITTEAFGEALPMACDDSAWGRQVNRRVEIWVD
jgi:phosphate transport system substrate-binding protein